jgi:heptosyltransferase I
LKLSALRQRDFHRILLIKPSAVGDVIHTVPLLAKLRSRYPHARIDWLLTPAIADLIQHHAALSNVVLFARHDYTRFGRDWSATTGLLRLLSGLRSTRYDVVIDMHGQFRSAILALATGAPVRIGFDRPNRRARRNSRPLPESAFRHGWGGTREGAWMAYTHRIPIPTLDAHAVDRYLWLSPILGLDDGPPDFRIPLPAAATTRVDAMLDQHGLRHKPFAILFPGTVWETKHWRVAGFAEVGRHLQRRGYGVVLAGASKERPRCENVAALCPGARNLCGQTTLSELAALIERAALTLTNDSGSMHLTVALDRPVVSVFGPTDPLWIGPYGRPGAVVRAQVPCAPCYLRSLRACPHQHACMEQVTADQVIRRVDETLSRTRPLACPA